MSEITIRVEDLGKRYRISGPQPRYRTLRDSLMEGLAAPFRRLASVARGESSRLSNETIWALKDVSFEVARGEVVGVIGRNGAGKSTLLKVLSRITEPSEGYAEIHGRVGSLLEVGTGFHQELTGRENIYLNGAILGMRKVEIDRKFDEIAAFSGVEKFLDTPVKHYSSGMRVRLAFSVAAHLEPEILLIDEVLAVGDAEFQKKCLGKMDDVARGGRTVLFVSHNMGAIRSLCGRCLLFGDGRLAMDGNPTQVVSHYLSAGFNEIDTGEVRWLSDSDAPGGREMKLRGVRLVAPSGELRSTFQIDDSIKIEILYEIEKVLRGMRVVVHLVTQEGVVAFASTDHRSRDPEAQPGRYRTACTIPGGLLNRGRYFVRVGAGIPGVKRLIPPTECTSFVAVGEGSHGSYFPENWPGVVAPRLEWETYPETRA